jgi:hypothetical protein
MGAAVGVHVAPGCARGPYASLEQGGSVPRGSGAPMLTWQGSGEVEIVSDGAQGSGEVNTGVLFPKPRVVNTGVLFTSFGQVSLISIPDTRAPLLPLR